MLADERQAAIIEVVNQRGTVSTADLIEEFEVSPITIRRDLSDLAERGLIVKVHGGARSIEANNNPTFEVKSSTNRAEKEAIGKVIASYIKDGESLMLSAGTTVAATARHLSGLKNLTVITDSAKIADEFAASQGTDIYLTGGRRAANDALVGPLSIATIERLNAKTLITSVHAADASSLTTPSIDEGEVLKAMIAACDRVIVGFDHSKWGVRALHTFASWEQVDVVVVDSQTPQEAIIQLKELVKEVVIAS